MKLLTKGGGHQDANKKKAMNLYLALHTDAKQISDNRIDDGGAIVSVSAFTADRYAMIYSTKPDELARYHKGKPPSWMSDVDEFVLVRQDGDVIRIYTVTDFKRLVSYANSQGVSWDAVSQCCDIITTIV